MNANIKERFESVKARETFTRVEKTGLLDFYVGLDAENRFAFKFRGQFIPEKNLKSAMESH